MHARFFFAALADQRYCKAPFLRHRRGRVPEMADNVMGARVRDLSPACVLFFLAPAIGELLSSSAPPSKFFNPPFFLVQAVLYGGGAIIVREITCRWNRGWPTVLALGAAYAIVEEGLMMKSFFDPLWKGLGPYGAYGRWLGVNWVWSLGLTIWHAVISISIPILLVNLIFPARRSMPWLSQRALGLLSVLFVEDVLYGALYFTQYRPPPVPYASAACAVVMLCLIARRLPRPTPRPGDAKPAHPFWFALTGFLTALGMLWIPHSLPSRGVHPLWVMAAIVGLVASAGWLILKMSGKGVAFPPSHQLAVATGVLLPYILLAPVWEFVAARSGNMTGMTAVAGLAVVFLFWIARRIRTRYKPSS